MLPTSFLALRLQLAQGITIDVQCKKLIEDLEAYPDRNMRLTIESVSEGDVNDVVKATVSFIKFDEYNKAFENRNYYDKNQVPCLNAREAGEYKVVDTLYFMNESDPNDYFTKLEDNGLHAAYNKNKVGDETYVQYLERVVLTNKLV